MTDAPDESNSSRLNRLSVERLRKRFRDAPMPAEGTAETDPPDNAAPEPEGARCSMCRHAAAEHAVDPETGFRPCRSIGHPKGLTCEECRRLTSPAHVEVVMVMRGDPLLKVAFGAYLATRAHVNDQLGESAPAFFTDVHESAVASALIEYGKAFSVLLDAEADGMSESWTRARGIVDGLRRAARRLRGDQS